MIKRYTAIVSAMAIVAFGVNAEAGREAPALDIDLDGKLSEVSDDFKLAADGTYTVATSFSAIFPRTGGERGIVLSFGSGWFDGFRLCIQPCNGGYSVGIEVAQTRKEKSDTQVLLLLDNKRSFCENEAVAFSASWDGKIVRLYVNGDEVASCRHERPFVHPQSNRVMIGKGGFGLPYHPIRPLRARIWRRALSGDEIKAVAKEDLKIAPAKFDYSSSSALSHLLSMCNENDIVCAELEERLAFALLKEGDLDNTKEYFQKTLNRKKASPYDARLEFCERWADALEAVGRCQLAEDIRKKVSDEADENLKQVFVPPEVWTASTNDATARTPDTFFYVSPEGNDGNAGTKDFPFATVAQAQQAVRKLKEEGMYPQSGVCVYLMGGCYPMRSQLVFEEADSGMPGVPVVWKGCPGERPVFDGGWRVPEMTKVTDPEVLSRLPAKARGRVLYCNVRAAGYRPCEAPSPYGVGSKACRRAITDLYSDGAWMQPARYPNEGFLRTEVGGHGYFSASKEICDAFAKERHLLATGFWKHLWLDATVKVRSAEDGSGRFNVVEPRGFDMSSAPGKPYFLCNALCALDRAGEWYLDSETGVLYLWPLENTRELVLSECSIVFLRMTKLHDVVFEGIVFENGRLDAVEMRNCSNVEFRKNIVRNFGRHGITAKNVKKVRISNNIFTGFGARAIYVSGGERKTLTPAENVISDNEIAFVERRERTYMPGLAVEGCGMDIARNHFHDMPSSAMRIEGNDYRVVSNLIERVVTESDDQGGIDIYRDPSYAGVWIAFNRFRDIGSPSDADDFASCGQAAVRLDGNVSGMTVYSNVFERCGRLGFGAVQINGGRNNRVEGNRFVDCWSGVSISYFSPMKWKAVMKDLRKLYEERVDIRSPPYSTKYPGIATLDEQTVQTNYVVRNVLVRTENLVSTRSPDVLVYGNTVSYSNCVWRK